MTATPNGWLLDPERLGQINAVAALIRFAPYKATDAQFKWYSWPVGDCTNKASWAYEMLKNWGWPEDAMKRWACDLPNGKRHAVLQVNTANMDGSVTPLIVDCRYPNPQVKDSLPYTDWCFVE